MGLPAVRHVERERSARPRLRLVVDRAAGRRRPCDPVRASRARFRGFVTVVVVVAMLGMGRVWLSVQAAEASLRSAELRSAIKAARYEGDMLEIRLSALASPSRIQAVAESSLGMAPASGVTYIDIREPEAEVAAADPGTQVASTGRGGGILADALGLAATEAQILLVGDVGLSAAR